MHKIPGYPHNLTILDNFFFYPFSFQRATKHGKMQIIMGKSPLGGSELSYG